MIIKRNLIKFSPILLLLILLFFFLYNKFKVVTVPIELYSNTIIVPTTINGVTYNFLLDTGAPTCISEDIFKKLNLKVKDSVKGKDFYDNKKWVKRTIIPRLKLKRFDINNIVVSIVKPLQNFKHNNLLIDGYLGVDVFNNLIIQINTKNKKLKLSKSLLNIKHRKNLNIKFETFGFQNTPLFPVSYSDGFCKDTAIFDTGYNWLYNIKIDSYNKLISNEIIKEENIIGTITAKNNNSLGLFGKHNNTINYYAKIDSVKIGKTTMFGFPVITFSGGDHSVIGAQLLKYGIGTFDFKKNIFFFEQYK